MLALTFHVDNIALTIVSFSTMSNSEGAVKNKVWIMLEIGTLFLLIRIDAWLNCIGCTYFESLWLISFLFCRAASADLKAGIRVDYMVD